MFAGKKVFLVMEAYWNAFVQTGLAGLYDISVYPCPFFVSVCCANLK